MKQKELLRKFCHCIKLVTKKVKKESYAIAICVKSVLQSRGKTLKKFSCKRQELSTRKRQKRATQKRATQKNKI